MRGEEGEKGRRDRRGGKILVSAAVLRKGEGRGREREMREGGRRRYLLFVSNQELIKGYHFKV